MNGKKNEDNKAAEVPMLFSIDRPKPSNHQAEVAVLGSMLISPEAVSTALSALNFDGAFFWPAHQTIFNAIMELNTGKNEAAVDIVVLADYLERTGKLEEIGGRTYLTELMDAVPTAANIEHYVDIVRQNAILRRIIDASSRAIINSYEHDEDVSSLLDSVQQSIFDIANMNQAKDFVSISKLAYDAIEYLDRLLHNDKGVMGIQTGFDMDRMITGLKPGELFVLAARPSIGKTAFALNMVTNIALGSNPHPVGIFSLEMPALQLVIRMLCSLTRISMSDFRHSKLSTTDWSEVMKVADQLQKSEIYIDDTGAIDILELRAKARRMRAQHNIQVIFIDYLQLIKVHSKSNASRENEVSMISGALKAMAKELNIPVVVLAQLNRQAEQQGEKPKLSHLRESGAIEQDADVVALLHRDRDKQYEQGEGNDDTPLKAELIIAKNRNGGTGKNHLLFFPRYTCFANAAPSESGDE
ncbi:MAG: replicative DNA helicase [Victivallales bacterium]|nr:replicative DNA helicase [Victivallales bacterium]